MRMDSIHSLPGQGSQFPSVPYGFAMAHHPGPSIARHLGSSEFGTLSSAWGLSNLLGLISVPWMKTGRRLFADPKFIIDQLDMVDLDMMDLAMGYDGI